MRVADWTRDAAALRDVRYEVFVVEQHVPEALEWDDIDAQCVHALAVDASGHVIGCGRLLPDGHIGRMAVRAPWRGRGVGAALLDLLVALARQRGHARVVLNAQTQAMPFYARARIRRRAVADSTRLASRTARWCDVALKSGARGAHPGHVEAVHDLAATTAEGSKLRSMKLTCPARSIATTVELRVP